MKIKQLAIAPLLCTLLLCACGIMQSAPAPEPTTAEHKQTEMYVDSAADEYALSCEPADGGWYELPVDFNTEEYAHIQEGGFVLTRTRPLSTVSADVDTASFGNLMRMLRQGYAADEIPSGAVRIEEMLNYFGYGYDTPAAGEDFAITARIGRCPWNPDTELAVLGFATAPEAAAADVGSNLVFLVDVSGSMDSEDKLGLLKQAFSVLVEQLDENDRVSIVTYANEERVVLDGAPGADRDRILRAIWKLTADGATNGERGLEMAYELAEKNFIEGGVNRIVMASDGDLNVGMTSESELHDYVDAKRETGVYLSVLGFGSGNYKDTKMETLADHGNGSYHYIYDVEEAERVLCEKLMANLVPFADDVKLQIEFNPAEVKAWRLIGYENREMADEDFRNDERDAGDVGPGAQFTVAYEIVRADSALELPELDLKYSEAAPAGESGEWLSCSLRWRSFADGQVHEITRALGEGDWSEDPGDDWRFAACVIEAGMALRGSEHAGASDISSARELLEECEMSGGRDRMREMFDLLRYSDYAIMD